MGLEAEIEALKRQNRRLKTALISLAALLLVGVVTVAGLAGIAATRARDILVVPGVGTIGFDLAYGFDDSTVGGWRPHFQIGRGL